MAVLTIEAAKKATLAEFRREFIKMAEAAHQRVMRTPPQPTTFTRIVDGRVGAPVESVSDFGLIVWKYPRLVEVARFALQVLRELSPVKSGLYRESHTLFIDGMPARDASDWEPGQELSITNTVPYSRKIELGAMTMRVPGSDRVYARARRLIDAEYGSAVAVEFTYRGFVGGASIDPLKTGPTVRAGFVRGAKGRFASGNQRLISGGAHNRSSQRFPVLIFRPR